MKQVLFLEGTEYIKLIEWVNNKFENVTKWLTENKLNVNMKKKSFMIAYHVKLISTGHDLAMQNSALTCAILNELPEVIIDHKCNGMMT